MVSTYDYDGFMADEKPPRPRPVLLPVGSVVGPLRDKIRAFAAETKKVFVSEHAERRMWERDISSIEMFEVLRMGDVVGAPWTEDSGETTCKVAFKKRGARGIGVVVILLTEDGILVKTVEWED